jgi:T5orf172 domain
MHCVYFVRERRAGSNLIKIGKTDDCPYLRLDQLRRAKRESDRHSSYELLGVIESPHENKSVVQSQFEGLRQEGDWFRPGLHLLRYIRQRTHPHFCNSSCPDGSAVEEVMRKLDADADEAVRGEFG